LYQLQLVLNAGKDAEQLACRQGTSCSWYETQGRTQRSWPAGKDAAQLTVRVCIGLL